MQGTTVEELLDDFEFLDNWEDRYRYIIELGDELDEMPDELKTETNRVRGCVSNVWLFPRLCDNDPSQLGFFADSDSQIVRGLVSIVLQLCFGKTTKNILDLDFENVFQSLELQSHLSRSRSNGLTAMIARIRNMAQAHIKTTQSA